MASTGASTSTSSTASTDIEEDTGECNVRGSGGIGEEGQQGHGLQRCTAKVHAVCRILDLAGSERQR